MLEEEMSITPALEILNTHGVHPSSEEPHGVSRLQVKCTYSGELKHVEIIEISKDFQAGDLNAKHKS